MIVIYLFILTLLCSAIEHTEMKLKIYLSEALMCSEFGYQHPMSDKKGLSFFETNSDCHARSKGLAYENARLILIVPVKIEILAMSCLLPMDMPTYVNVMGMYQDFTEVKVYSGI